MYYELGHRLTCTVHWTWSYTYLYRTLRYVIHWRILCTELCCKGIWWIHEAQSYTDLYIHWSLSSTLNVIVRRARLYVYLFRTMTNYSICLWWHHCPIPALNLYLYIFIYLLSFIFYQLFTLLKGRYRVCCCCSIVLQIKLFKQMYRYN